MAQTNNSSVNVPNKLISTLFAQKNSNAYCDINLKFGEVELRAHSCVVAAFSPFVDDFLSSGEVMPLSTAGTKNAVGTVSCVMPLGDAKFKCLDCAMKVIDFMYLGKIQIDDLHLEHIKAVSESLQVSELLKICRKHSEKFSERIKSLDDCQDNLVISGPVTAALLEEEPMVLSKSLNLEGELPPMVPTSERTILSGDASPLPVNSMSASDDMDESEWSGMKCPKCAKILMNLALYQQHCGTHLGKTYTACYVCNYASIRVPDVIKHLQEMDHGEKVCSICLLEVSCSQSLKEHLQIHDQAQPFFCLTCSTRFQTRTALNSHIVRHSNETPFVCKECGRGFKWKHGLRSHMVTHSKLKSFLCDQCGFSTAHLRSFIDHKAAHSGEKFKCPKPDCQFSSVRRASVKHHLMTHSKQKPYQCEVCGQAFSQNKNLRRHAASHNPSADPEKCPLCSYQTNRSDKFKAHFKRYHKDGERDCLGTKRKSSTTAKGQLSKSVPRSPTQLSPDKRPRTEKSCVKLSSRRKKQPQVPHGESSENIVLQVSQSINKQFVVLNTNEGLSTSDSLYTLSDGTYVLMDVANLDDLADNMNSVDVPIVMCDSNPVKISVNDGTSMSIKSFPILEIFDNVSSNESNKS